MMRHKLPAMLLVLVDPTLFTSIVLLLSTTVQITFLLTLTPTHNRELPSVTKVYCCIYLTFNYPCSRTTSETISQPVLAPATSSEPSDVEKGVSSPILLYDSATSTADIARIIAADTHMFGSKEETAAALSLSGNTKMYDKKVNKVTYDFFNVLRQIPSLAGLAKETIDPEGHGNMLPLFFIRCRGERNPLKEHIIHISLLAFAKSNVS